MDTSYRTKDPPVISLGDQIKKYIRTYEGDIQALRGGGVPALVPFIPPPLPPPSLAAARPAMSVIPPAPPPRMSNKIPAPPPPTTTQSIPPPPPVVIVQSAPPPLEEKKESAPSALETYSNDFVEHVQNTRASAATLLASRLDAGEGGAAAPEPPKKSFPMTWVYTLMGVVLLIGGGTGVYLAYRSYSVARLPVSVTTTVPAPILVDDRVTVLGSGANLMHAIENSVAVPLAPGTVRLLYNANAVLASSTAESLFVQLHTSAPGILTRNVNAKGSMAGVVNVSGAQSPFFILSVSSYSETFAGMFAWEPRMLDDLTFFIPPPLTIASSTPSTASGQAATSTAPLPTGHPLTFVDDTVANHDVRIARDAEKKPLLVYGYWNPTTLVIARDPAAFTEILDRLANAHTQP